MGRTCVSEEKHENSDGTLFRRFTAKRRVEDIKVTKEIMKGAAAAAKKSFNSLTSCFVRCTIFRMPRSLL